MKKNKSIQFKAVTLLIVFSLNTIVGFACAVGLDMGFNSHHHLRSSMEDSENHHHDKSHHPDEADAFHHKTNNDKDNCCNDSVMKFQKVDKALISSITVINPVFFTFFFASFYNIDILFFLNKISHIKYFVRSHHPPIPDIRIAIQSFQI